MKEEKGKEIQGGKRRRGLIKGKGIWRSDNRKRNPDQSGRWKEEGSFSRIKIIKASWTRVLFDDVVFH